MMSLPKFLPPANEPSDRRPMEKWLSDVEGGGGPPHDGGMNEWAQSVENRLSRIDEDIRDLRRDFRWTWGGMAAMFLVTIGALASGFLYLADKIDRYFLTVIDKLPS